MKMKFMKIKNYSMLHMHVFWKDWLNERCGPDGSGWPSSRIIIIISQTDFGEFFGMKKGHSHSHKRENKIEPKILNTPTSVKVHTFQIMLMALIMIIIRKWFNVLFSFFLTNTFLSCSTVSSINRESVGHV